MNKLNFDPPEQKKSFIFRNTNVKRNIVLCSLNWLTNYVKLNEAKWQQVLGLINLLQCLIDI